jgi:hypothetical protein
MHRRITRHIRSNVVGYLALFVALSGTAYAVDGPLPGQNQVGSADIINNDVQSADIKDANVTNLDLRSNAVTAGKILDGEVSSADVQDNSLTASDINESTLRSCRPPTCNTRTSPPTRAEAAPPSVSAG